MAQVRDFLGVLALSVVAVTLVPPLSAGAAGWGDGCNPHRTPNDWKTYRWAGYFMWDADPFSQGFNAATQGVGAVEANILEYSPWVQPEPANSTNEVDDVSAWVMLQANQPVCTTCDYAQAGWNEQPYTVRHEFVQWSDHSGHFWDFPPNNNTGAIVNNYVTYRTEYNPSDKRIRFYMSDQNCSTNPCQAVRTVDASKLGWLPEIAFVSGETHSKDDQMAGGSGFPETFWWPQIATPQYGTYHLSNTIRKVSGQTGSNVDGEPGAYEGDQYYNVVPAGVTNLQGWDYFDIYDLSCGH